MKKNQTPKLPRPPIGSEIYVESHFYISHGSDDVVGGLAKVSRTYQGVSGGNPCIFVEVEEHPGNSYNWTQILSKEQAKLHSQFGKKRAYPSPDIDTPWIEEGDIVDGKPYHGKPIW